MNLVVKAEEILKVQIELEKMIFNKDKNKEQDIKQEDIFSNKNEIIESKEVSVISYKSGFLEDPVDFDDDIPFAPIGLQYREILSCI